MDNSWVLIHQFHRPHTVTIKSEHCFHSNTRHEDTALSVKKTLPQQGEYEDQETLTSVHICQRPQSVFGIPSGETQAEPKCGRCAEPNKLQGACRRRLRTSAQGWSEAWMVQGHGFSGCRYENSLVHCALSVSCHNTCLVCGQKIEHHIDLHAARILGYRGVISDPPTLRTLTTKGVGRRLITRRNLFFEPCLSSAHPASFHPSLVGDPPILVGCSSSSFLSLSSCLSLSLFAPCPWLFFLLGLCLRFCASPFLEHG